MILLFARSKIAKIIIVDKKFSISGVDTTKHGAHACHYNVDIIYQNELLSDENTLVPPIITDLHATGQRDLVFATLNSAHLINGRTGDLQRGIFSTKSQLSLNFVLKSKIWIRSKITI